MDELRSRILAEHLGKLGGKASQFAARFLPDVPYESCVDFTASPDDVRETATALLAEIGCQSPDLPDLSVICGSGHSNMNPTIVSITITPLESGCRALIHAVAKEGLVKQASAKKAVERVKELLVKRCV